MSKPIPIPPRKEPQQVLLDPPEWHPRKDGKRWSEIEDKLLKLGVEKHGVNAWGKVARMVWFRNPAQCRARWAELVPILHDELARQGAAAGGSPASTSSDDGTIRGRSRAASPTSTASSTPTLTNPQPTKLMCIEGSSPPPEDTANTTDTANTAEDTADALRRYIDTTLQTPTLVPAPGPSQAAKGKGKATTSKSSISSIIKRPRTRPATPLDASPPLLNPSLSPPPPFEMSPPSPPGHTTPLLPSRRSKTTPTLLKSKFSSLSILSSLVAPLKRDRSKTLTALTEEAATTSQASAASSRTAKKGKEPAKKKNKTDGGKEGQGSDEDQQWLSPRPMMPGLYRKPSRNFSSNGLRK